MFYLPREMSRKDRGACAAEEITMTTNGFTILSPGHRHRTLSDGRMVCSQGSCAVVRAERRAIEQRKLVLERIERTLAKTLRAIRQYEPRTA